MKDCSLDGLDARTAEVFRTFPVRKTTVQKQAFRAHVTQLLQAAGWPVQVQTEGKLMKSHNIVAGNPQTARLVLTAHYDTPARLPFPNFLAPRNLFVSLLYQVFIGVLFFLLAYGSMRGLRWLGVPSGIALLVTAGVLFFLLWLVLFGPANPTNANDNTSGVLVLLQSAFALPAEARGDVALVFFDNEEAGLVGSGKFSKRYKGLPRTPLLNFDCVGDGDTLLFVLGKSCKRDKPFLEKLEQAFQTPGEKQLLLDDSPLTLYPSDQISFKKGIGIVALRRAPLLGLHISRIHTKKDTVLDPSNILLLQRGCVALAQLLPQNAPPAS